MIASRAGPAVRWDCRRLARGVGERVFRRLFRRGPLLSCLRALDLAHVGRSLISSSGAPPPVGLPQGFQHVANPSPSSGPRRPRTAAGRCSRRAVLRALPLAVVAGVTGCDVGPQHADLPPVTPLPVESVRVAPFTPTPTLSPTAAVLAAAEATPLPAGTTVRFAGWGTCHRAGCAAPGAGGLRAGPARGRSRCAAGQHPGG